MPPCGDHSGFPIFFIVHPYNKAPLLRGPDSLFLAPSTASQLAFFLDLLMMNHSNIGVYLLIQELFNAYCVPGTALSFGS